MRTSTGGGGGKKERIKGKPFTSPLAKSYCLFHFAHMVVKIVSTHKPKSSSTHTSLLQTSTIQSNHWNSRSHLHLLSSFKNPFSGVSRNLPEVELFWWQFPYLHTAGTIQMQLVLIRGWKQSNASGCWRLVWPQDPTRWAWFAVQSLKILLGNCVAKQSLQPETQSIAAFAHSCQNS